MNLSYEFVRHAREISGGDLIAINRLLKQLNPRSRELTMTDLGKVVACCHLLLARDGELQSRIAGLASLVCFSTPFTRHGRVEDVVVDQEYRGHGIGREMMARLLARAKEEGVLEVGLTSHPSRQAANALYQNLGFRRVETNVYEMILERCEKP